MSEELSFESVDRMGVQANVRDCPYTAKDSYLHEQFIVILTSLRLLNSNCLIQNFGDIFGDGFICILLSHNPPSSI